MCIMTTMHKVFHRDSNLFGTISTKKKDTMVEWTGSSSGFPSLFGYR